MSKVKDIVLQLSGLYKIYGKKLENEIKTGDIPNHIALILDGNRRWAKPVSYTHLTLPTIYSV